MNTTANSPLTQVGPSPRKTILDSARPLLRALPRGSGTLYKWLGGYRQDPVWETSGLRMTESLGRGHRLKLDLSDTVERETYYLGRFFEWELQAAINQYVRPGDTFLDVGANIGMITLEASAAVSSVGRVLSFEPNPAVRQRLQGHVEMNGLKNVQVFDNALGAEPGSATLTTASAHTGTGTLRSQEGALNSYTVPVKTLDSLADLIPVDRRVFLKIDTEGYDYNVLRGARELLARPGIKVFAEVSHKWMTELGQTASEMFDYMESLGFNAYHPRVEKGLLLRRLKLDPLVLPGPHHWFNAFFSRGESVDGG
jgi:FkbM family methyltransferase